MVKYEEEHFFCLNVVLKRPFVVDFNKKLLLEFRNELSKLSTTELRSEIEAWS